MPIVIKGKNCRKNEATERGAVMLKVESAMFKDKKAVIVIEYIVGFSLLILVLPYIVTQHGLELGPLVGISAVYRMCRYCPYRQRQRDEAAIGIIASHHKTRAKNRYPY